MNQFTTTKELEQFCREHGFLYHAHGSGKWGSERYWSYYKVENNDRTVFSIEYFPVSSAVRISIANNRYYGGVESVTHLLELLAAMRINIRRMKKILYVYGYGGSATGSTVTMLERLMPEGYTVESFTYTQADCAKARKEIFEYIREHEINLVIGSSLGGFITHTLQGVPRILVNPCWLPSVELPKIGAPAEFVATYAPFEQWSEEHAAEDSELVHAFFADKDELLGDKYVGEFLRHYPESHCHRIHSGHHLSEDGAKAIIEYLIS